jgi:hypothetical protein
MQAKKTVENNYLPQQEVTQSLDATGAYKNIKRRTPGRHQVGVNIMLRDGPGVAMFETRFPIHKHLRYKLVGRGANAGFNGGRHFILRCVRHT